MGNESSGDIGFRVLEGVEDDSQMSAGTDVKGMQWFDGMVLGQAMTSPRLVLVVTSLGPGRSVSVCPRIFTC